MNPEQYLDKVKSLLIANSRVKHFYVVREITFKDAGLYRIKVELVDGGVLEIFEYFVFSSSQIEIIKYSYHLQNKNKNLIKRWDNAPHHLELSTFPDHAHVGDDSNVFVSNKPTLEEILEFLSKH